MPAQHVRNKNASETKTDVSDLDMENAFVIEAIKTQN